MLRFNTSFLLKAAAVTAFCCLPMALNRESGFVWTAFLLPISIATLASTLVPQPGPCEIKFKERPNSVVEISRTGGRAGHWIARSRIITAGAFLSFSFGPPFLNQVDPEPMAMWL